ncbi:hypothetical protein B9Z55_020345 [Caenorhabditis nigoni]|uniref:RecQ-mediated genome instability protein 1 n=1 Tax=Caenorhabditis nigoni TaxID=1611254 RepID=A0A2G5TMC0_9PELO|nr:hypothetical protein B9Z55_020345 [Caenorhabditis nigoni]
MSSKCTFLLQYFGDRHILLKEEWLNSVIDFLHNQVPLSRDFDNEKFANLVLDQWACSNIESTSFPAFGNHGIDSSIQKQHLQGPIVCQVNGFIDTGSPYYQQYCNLNRSGKKEDNSGFEKVFHEKEDDSDQKPSRLLKLSLTDGESSLNAIEFWKCPQLSLYCKPGTKLLIEPPCDIRRGTFLLKPGNCRILGGEVLPLLNCHLPVEEYARMLKIKDHKPSTSTPVPSERQESSNHPSTSASVSRPNPLPSQQGPSSMISRYFQKKPVPCTPSTSRAPEPREVSPDVFGEENHISDSEGSDYENQHSSTRRSKEGVLVSSLIRRIQNDDEEEFEPTRRIPNRSPKKQTKTPPLEALHRRSTGILTSRRIDPMDELLEGMIEKDEEPVSCPNQTKNPFRVQAQPPLKKVKMEAESDDDIQVIELVTPPPPQVKKERLSEAKGEDVKKKEEEESYSKEEREALKAFSSLKLSTLIDSLKKMKYSIGSKRFLLLAFIDDIVEPLRVVDELWTMKVSLKDDSGTTEAFIDNSTLHSLIGYTCQEAIAVRKSSDLEKRRDGKRRLEALEQQLQRLDLVFEIEFFSGTATSCPVVRSMKTLAEQIDVY